MTPVFSQYEQGTYEWLVDRIPYVTASNVSDVMAKGKGATRRNYLTRKLCESLSGVPTATYKSQKMRDGNEREATARQLYEAINECSVKQLPFAYIPGEGIGASTDGEVDSDGLVEIKNVMSSEQIELLTTGKIKDKYIKQMQTQMYVLNKKWCDFVSVALGDDESGELPNYLKVKIVRVLRDEDEILNIRREVAFFWNDINQLKRKLGITDEQPITSDTR